MKRDGCLAEINFLGAFDIVHNDMHVHFPYEKPKIVCAYLITEGRPVYRSYLASMLWPDMTETYALQNLRQSLAVLKKVFGDDYRHLFRAGRQTLEFIGYPYCDIDTEALKRHARLPLNCDNYRHSTDEGAMLLEVYRGQFCQGLNVSYSNELYDWLELQRREFQSLALTFARKLIRCYKEFGMSNHAVEIYRHMLLIDRYDESLVAEFMEYLIESGQRPHAIKLYREYEERLRSEHGIRPDRQLSYLHESLLQE